MYKTLLSLIVLPCILVLVCMTTFCKTISADSFTSTEEITFSEALQKGILPNSGHYYSIVTPDEFQREDTTYLIFNDPKDKATLINCSNFLGEPNEEEYGSPINVNTCNNVFNVSKFLYMKVSSGTYLHTPGTKIIMEGHRESQTCYRQSHGKFIHNIYAEDEDVIETYYIQLFVSENKQYMELTITNSRGISEFTRLNYSEANTFAMPRK